MIFQLDFPSLYPPCTYKPGVQIDLANVFACGIPKVRTCQNISFAFSSFLLLIWGQPVVWVLYSSHLGGIWSFEWRLSLRVDWQTEQCWQNGRFQTLSLGQESPSELLIHSSFEGLVSQCSTQHPVNREDFCLLLLEERFCNEKAKSRSFFFLFIFYLFFLWQRVDSRPKVLWLSWAWHLSLGPACPICLCIYIPVDTLASFSRTACDAFSSELDPGRCRAQMLKAI